MSEGVARLFHNKYFVYLERFAANYFQYTSINFLFINGPAEATYGMMPGSGVIYWFELPFLLGFFYLLFTSNDKRAYFFILFWILLAPIPAALTTGRGFAGNRAEVILPALTMVSAIGGYAIFTLVKKYLKPHFVKITLLGFGCISILGFLSFLENYFVLSPYKFAKDMLYGNLEVAGWLTQNTEREKSVVVSRSLSEPHIYFAFVNPWEPTEYQRNSSNWAGYRDQNLKFLDQLGEYGFANFLFTSMENKNIEVTKDTLLVGRPEEFPAGVIPKVRFDYPNGDPAVYVVEPLREVYAKSSN